MGVLFLISQGSNMPSLYVETWKPLLEGSEGDVHMYDLITSFYACALNGDISVINELMGEIDPAKVSTAHLTTILRGNFRFNNQLSNWALLRDRTIELINERGDDLVVMQGMLDTSWYTPNPTLDELLHIHPSLRTE